MRVRAGALALAILAGCADPASRPEAKQQTVAPAPRTYPARLPVADFTGAAACAECHPKEHALWKRSPHGRAMAEPSADTVLGSFDGRAIAVADGVVTPLRDGAKWMMKIETDAAHPPELASVDLVLGSGRQHQIYLSRAPDRASYQMLPLIWITVTRTWISAARYQRAGTDPASDAYWRKSDVVELGCTSCHLSQGRVRADALEWTDLPINCESCHGPGRSHVEQRKRGEDDASYGDLHSISKEVDVALCAQCHARKNPFYLGHDGEGVPRISIGTLALPAFRADGTQLVTGYQTAGHLISRCFLEGAMSCSSCHDPHAQTARNLLHESAQGADSNRQCTVCHRDRISERAAEKHAHHSPKRVHCTDCHMRLTWMMDDPALVQRVADHSISIPRPRESIELGLPNACTTCHRERSARWALEAVERWGAKRATEVRPWVEALSFAKTGDARAPERLARVLTSSATAPFIRLSALDATLDLLPGQAQLIPILERFTHDETDRARSIAHRALMRHDPAHRLRRRDRGLEDPSAEVRIEVMLSDDSGEGLSRASIERTLSELMELSSIPPVESSAHLRALLERAATSSIP